MRASSSMSHCATASVITVSSVKREPCGNSTKSIRFVLSRSYTEPTMSPTTAPSITRALLVFSFILSKLHIVLFSIFRWQK
ncbi:MAG: hypothetical protein II578_03160 [Bacteroidaceae bacterium]|nr:hypothetical protein [Bacteroidaceae bacterium]